MTLEKHLKWHSAEWPIMLIFIMLSAVMLIVVLALRGYTYTKPINTFMID
jgi:hypothetical protein